jgi:hypothetical protein
MHFPLQEFTRNISAESIYCKAFTRALKKISKKIKKGVAKKKSFGYSNGSFDGKCHFDDRCVAQLARATDS